MKRLQIILTVSPETTVGQAAALKDALTKHPNVENVEIAEVEFDGRKPGIHRARREPVLVPSRRGLPALVPSRRTGS
jgi:hypothetical protein